VDVGNFERDTVVALVDGVLVESSALVGRLAVVGGSALVGALVDVSVIIALKTTTNNKKTEIKGRRGINDSLAIDIIVATRHDTMRCV
jgi:hypothetical protein